VVRVYFNYVTVPVSIDICGNQGISKNSNYMCYHLHVKMHASSWYKKDYRCTLFQLA